MYDRGVVEKKNRFIKHTRRIVMKTTCSEIKLTFYSYYFFIHHKSRLKINKMKHIQNDHFRWESNVFYPLSGSVGYWIFDWW